MFVVFCLVALVASVASVDDTLDQQWLRYQELYNKDYSRVEERVRRDIWESNIAFINNHNMEADLDIHSFHVGINQFTDMTNEEFRKLNGFRGQDNQEQTNIYQPEGGALPVTVDWRSKGYVTPIKNQGQCGSCWAFSTTGSLEGQHFKKSGKLVSLSEQNLMDCSTAEGNQGCEGGLMSQAFDYIIKNKGLDTEDCYPYEGSDMSCRFKASCVGATMQSYTKIKSGSEDDLQTAAANIGPISVAIDASSLAFQFYRSGVFDHPSCSSTELDHGVLVVGYGVDGGKDYWLVKNSWGTIWGNQGYIEMSRNKDNQCGIATQASYPVV